MSSHGHPARAPVAMRGVEALAMAALTNLWRSMDRILPLGFALALFHALVHARPHGAGDNVWPLQAILETEASTLTALVVTALASAVALRIFLGRPREALKPDQALGGYVAVFTLLGVAPLMILMGLHPLEPGVSASQLHDDIARAVFGVAVGMAMFWISLRLTLWPIAKLLDDSRVTAAQSWTLMRGAVIRYAGAVSILTAPLIVANALVSVVTDQMPLIHQAAIAPLNAAITLVATAVAAEVYRNRMNLPG
jgi:hypothetical protein